MPKRKLAHIHPELERLQDTLMVAGYSKDRSRRVLAELLGVSYSTVLRELEPEYRARQRAYDARPESRARRNACLRRLRRQPSVMERHREYSRRRSAMAYRFPEYVSEMLNEYNEDVVALSDIADWFERRFNIRPRDATIRKQLERYIAAERTPPLSEYLAGQYRLLA